MRMTYERFTRSSRGFLRSLLLTGFLLTWLCSVWAAQGPNVIFILIDDLGHYGVSAYGCNLVQSKDGLFGPTSVSTPNIDRMANEGVRCEYAFALPLCEPTRVSLMTGKSNMRNFIQSKSLHESEITFSDVFKREGYNTCIVGKWKQSRGTKEFPGKDYIFKFGWDEFFCFDVIGEGRRFIEPWIVDNGKPHVYNGIDPVTGRRYYGPDLFNRYALDYIERKAGEAKAGKPFFLYYPMVLVHDEHTPTPDTKPNSIFDDFDHINKSRYGHMNGDDRRYFPDMIRYADKMIGKTLQKVRDLGLAENTLVIVMGDNGTKECFDHVLPNGTIYPGGKGMNTDNGLRVPLVLSWPEKLPKQRVYKGLVNLTDIYPTLMAATGINDPNLSKVDGISFWPQALGQDVPHRREIFTWYNGNGSIRNQEKLLVYAHDQQFKLYAPDQNFPEGRFFDLRNDPLEESGDKEIKWGYKRNIKSGLNMKQLTEVQIDAHRRLSKVIEANRFQELESLKCKAEEMSLKIGEEKQIQVQLQPASSSRNSLVLKSSDPSIASVDKFGWVVAHRSGRAVISVYSWHDAYPVSDNGEHEFKTSGMTDQITVTVK